MMTFSLRSISALAVATVMTGSVYAADADPSALALVKQQFVNAKIVPDVLPSFSPSDVLTVSFNSSSPITTGEPIPKSEPQQLPTITVAGPTNSTGKYTIMMVDGNYVGSSNPQGLNLHYLQNNVVIDSNGGVSNTSAATIPFAGPAPAPGTGPHRYTILLFGQPSNFTAPSSPVANSGVHMINLATYVSDAGLTGPYAGTYFTVEVGTATVSVQSTTAVDTATLSMATTTGSSGSHTSTGTSPFSSPTESHKSGASKVGPAVLGGSVLGFLGMAALLA